MGRLWTELLRGSPPTALMGTASTYITGIVGMGVFTLIPMTQLRVRSILLLRNPIVLLAWSSLHHKIPLGFHLI
jgi:hypothetical protein